ncbi:MAG TPA: 16S rRNA (guanine(966)-N(2))-methyltransferase RsmD [Actinomycetes bacterium]|nr:16S rRNA (guanine(966)-N(2))-methyltransferase RsmD [Actinomycetes bacterium]
MVRVTGGRLAGRRLRAVAGTLTRPTSDRVRQSLFGVLGERVAGTRVLDLFAGTGALAIEALSRGAASAVLVESVPAAVAVARANLEDLGLSGQATVRRTRAESWLRTQRDGVFDLVLLDPPYELRVGFVAGVLGRLSRTALAADALVVLEAAARGEAPPWPPGLEPFDARRYGDTAVHLARWTGPAGSSGRTP